MGRMEGGERVREGSKGRDGGRSNGGMNKERGEGKRSMIRYVKGIVLLKYATQCLTIPFT